MSEWFQIAGLALKISIMAQVFAIGAGTTWAQATYLFRHPALLRDSILARNVAVPVIALLLIELAPLPTAIAITLGVLAVTPVPPLLPKSQLRAGARSEYVMGLLFSQSILAIVLVPVTIELMNLVSGAHASFRAVEVAKLVAGSILVPLLAGMAVSRMLPQARRLFPLLTTAGTILLAAGSIPFLLLAWRVLGAMAGSGALLALAIFVAASMAAGHLLGGPLPGDRTTLAIACASRHPAIAVAIAGANFPEQKIQVAGAVLIYLLLRAVVAVPYGRLRRGA